MSTENDCRTVKSENKSILCAHSKTWLVKHGNTTIYTSSIL